MDKIKKTDKAIKKLSDTHGQRAAKKKSNGNTQPEKPKENVNTTNWVYGFLGD